MHTVSTSVNDIRVPQLRDALDTKAGPLVLVVFSPCSIPSAATNCVEKKRDVISKLEAKIESGIEK